MELRARLERANAAHETFFDLATHELRSPLSAILGYQELLEDGLYGTLDDPSTDAVVRMGRSARHLVHLIDGVIEISRIRSGAARPNDEDVNLGLVFAALADSFRTSARERDLEPRVTMPDSLPTIRSDRERLVRALELIVISSVKNPSDDWIGMDITPDTNGATVRVSGTRILVLHDVEDLAFRLGIRIAVADAVARLLHGSLDLESDDDGIIRALSFHVRDLAQAPAVHP